MIRALLALIRKDLLLELRTKESIAFLFSLSLIFAIVVSLGINTSMAGSIVISRLFPSLVWIVFIFTATLAIGRNLDNDLEHRALDGLITIGVSPALIFAAKVVSVSLITLLGILLTVIWLGTLMNVSFFPLLLSFLLIALFVAFGFAALATIAAGIASTSKVKVLLMPLVLLPLLFPLFFCASELTAALFANNTLDIESIWLSLLLGLDVVYIVIGMNLYEHIIRE